MNWASAAVGPYVQYARRAAHALSTCTTPRNFVLNLSLVALIALPAVAMEVWARADMVLQATCHFDLVNGGEPRVRAYMEPAFLARVLGRDRPWAEAVAAKSLAASAYWDKRVWNSLSEPERHKVYEVREQPVAGPWGHPYVQGGGSMWTHAFVLTGGVKLVRVDYQRGELYAVLRSSLASIAAASMLIVAAIRYVPATPSAWHEACIAIACAAGVTSLLFIGADEALSTVRSMPGLAVAEPPLAPHRSGHTYATLALATALACYAFRLWSKEEDPSD